MFTQSSDTIKIKLYSPPVNGPVHILLLSTKSGSRFISRTASRQASFVMVENMIFCKMLTGPLPMPFELAPHPVKVDGPLGGVFGGGMRIG